MTTGDLAAARTEHPGLRLGVIVPVGAVEQHGAFLSVTCDTDIAIGAASAVACALGRGDRYRAWAAPAVPYGPVPGAELTPGTSAVGFSELGAYLAAVVSGFAVTGAWDFVIIVNAHAHNHGRAIEASSLAYSRYRVPILVLHVYEYVHTCSGMDLVAGSHGGEFEISLHHYYTGVEPRARELEPCPPPRPRPASVYGLDLLPRSLGGILAPGVPSVARALAAADRVGQRIDAALSARVSSDLDTYFEHWRQPPARGAHGS